MNRNSDNGCGTATLVQLLSVSLGCRGMAFHDFPLAGAASSVKLSLLIHVFIVNLA